MIASKETEVIDKVRRAKWRVAAEQDKAFIKGQRYNLFRNEREPEARAGGLFERAPSDE